MVQNRLTKSYVPVYTFQLDRLAESRSYGRRRAKVRARLGRLPRGEEWEPTIAAIMLVEMRERGGWRRGAEWLAHSFGVGALRSKPLTLGPLQLANSPWNLGDAAERAVDYLACGDCRPAVTRADWEAVARMWHGASSLQPGQAISYSRALLVANGVLSGESRAAGPRGGSRTER